MCNSIFVSTDSDQDLSLLSTDHLHFEHLTEKDKDLVAGVLTYPSLWYLSGFGGGCSCHFRHRCPGSTDPLFRGQEEWDEEDEDDAQATRAVYDVFKCLVEGGYRLQALDLWNDELPAEIHIETVDISQVPTSHFGFLEGSRFEFIAK